MIRINETDIKSITGYNHFIKYCNKERVDEVSLLGELRDITIDLCNLVRARYGDVVQYLDIKSMVKTKDTGETTLVCILEMDFVVCGVQGHYLYLIVPTGYSNFINEICETLRFITRGNQAVASLNEAVKEIQSRSGSNIIISYKTGDSNYSKSNKSVVEYWDFNRVVIRLSVSSVNSLIVLYEKEEISNTVGKNSWNYDIKTFIGQSREIAIHSTIGMMFKSNNIIEILKENMLSSDDVIRYIDSNKSAEGIQNIISVENINELGRFIAIVNWSIDYDKKDVRVEILDEKIYDIDDGNFIADKDMYGRIKNRIKAVEKIQFNWGNK